MEGRSASARHSNGKPRAPTRQDLAALAVSRGAASACRWPAGAGDADRRRGPLLQFDVSNLGPATTYELQLVAPDGGTLSDPWPLKTHPAPDAEVDHLRILAYTCAGGYDGPPLHGQTIWLDMAPRRCLLARGLGFQPDVVIANGDQIYWDLRTIENKSEDFGETRFSRMFRSRMPAARA